MPFTDSALNVGADAIAAASRWVSAHTADPGSTGLNEVAGGSYARQQTTWPSAASGDTTGSQVAIPIPASTSVTHWGLWSAATGGSFRGGFALGATEVFGAGGTLNHTPTLDADAV
jgi:hypothetical protein